MGACSIKGGNVGGIPDRQQRSRTLRRCSSILLDNTIHHHPDYFDPPEQEQEQTQVKAKPVQVEKQGSTLNATGSENPMLVGKQMHRDDL